MIIGLIGLIGLIAIMDRYLEFANHLRDFAAADLLSESQTCLVKVAAKNAVACSKFRSVQHPQEKMHGMKHSHRLACYILAASLVTNSYICAAGFFLHQPESLLSCNYGHVIVLIGV